MAEEPAKDKTPDESEAPVEDGAAPATGAEDGSAATVAERALDAASQAAGAIASEVDLPDFGSGADGVGSSDIGLLGDVNLQVKIELGRTRMLVEDVLRLNADSVIELDKAAGDPVDIFVNDRHVARGEVLVVNENFCVRVSEIIEPGGVVRDAVGTGGSTNEGTRESSDGTD